MSTIIAVCNQKGGVSKTEIAIHLAAALARANFGKNGTKKWYDPNFNENVGLVDLDPQGHYCDVSSQPGTRFATG